MEMELISIIMPSYNSAATICASIDSVLEQSYNNWELLITDDCSTDNTLDIIKDYALKDKRIKFFENVENSGAGIARNTSISKAEGRFIAFLDSDDIWKPEKLTKQIEFMLNNGYALTYTYYLKINEFDQVTGKIHPPSMVDYNELLKSNVIGCLTAVYDVNILGKIYMPSIRKRQDMALWLKILKIIPHAYCLQEELAVYREGHQSLSSNKIKILLSQWQFYRYYLKLSIGKSVCFFVFYVIRALKKHRINT